MRGKPITWSEILWGNMAYHGKAGSSSQSGVLHRNREGEAYNDGGQNALRECRVAI